MKAKLLAVVLGLLLSLGIGVAKSTSAATHCEFGRAMGFVSIRAKPQYLVGTIPSRFTGDPHFFTRRYNCRGRGVQVRRVSLGVYDVYFPGQRHPLAVASAVSDEGIAASAWPLGIGVVRVSLRGPLVTDNVAVRRDVAFSLVIY